jgi:hypothetical protein
MDFRLSSNRIGVAVPVLAGFVAGAWALAVAAGLGEAVRVGVGAGGGSFLAWASARELDPDRPTTATVAALAAPWAVLAGGPALAAGFLWMIAVRALIGSTGGAPYPADVTFVGVLAAWAATGDRGLAAALAGLLVVAASTAFDRRGRSVTLVLVAAWMVAAVAASIAFGGPVRPLPVSGAAAWWMGGIAVVGSMAMRVRTSAATDRRPDQRVSLARLRWGVAAATSLSILAVVWHGVDGVTAAAPIIAALAATAVSAGVKRVG